MNRLIALLMFGIALSAGAAEARLEAVSVDLSAAALERGAQVLMDICHGCHTLKYVRYRDLQAAGIDRKKIDAWRGEQGLDGVLSSSMSEEAALQSFNKVPPDLSMMVAARDGGASYVYSYLLGYYATPEGAVNNHLFPETKMPDVLAISSADASQRSEIQRNAKDVVSFLTWAADPHQQERRTLGYYVLGYLFVLTLLMYALKRRIWSRLKPSDVELGGNI